MTDYSLADIRAVTQGENSSGFGGGNIGMLAFFLFFLLAWGNGGFGLGGNSGTLTRADLTAGFNFNSVDNQLRSVGNGIAESTFAITNQLNAMQMQNANCCCETQKALIENRYDAERNACSIVDAIHKDGEATRALINANTMQDLRDRLEQSEREKLASQFQLSQQAQTANIVNELRPCAKPCYLTCSPYVSNTCNSYGCF